MPPSPVLITLRGWNEKQAMSPCGWPILCDCPSVTISLPIAQAASSTTATPRRRPISTMLRMSHGMPIWWTQRIARVRGVMACSISAGSMLKVAWSMSMKTGSAPQ